MPNDKIDSLKIGSTTYDIDLPADATPSVSSLTTSGNATIGGTLTVGDSVDIGTSASPIEHMTIELGECPSPLTIYTKYNGSRNTAIRIGGDDDHCISIKDDVEINKNHTLSFANSSEKYATISPGTNTSNITLTLPDTTGTLALTSEIPSITFTESSVKLKLDQAYNIPNSANKIVIFGGYAFDNMGISSITSDIALFDPSIHRNSVSNSATIYATAWDSAGSNMSTQDAVVYIYYTLITIS